MVPPKEIIIEKKPNIITYNVILYIFELVFLINC